MYIDIFWDVGCVFIYSLFKICLPDDGKTSAEILNSSLKSQIQSSGGYEVSQIQGLNPE